MSLFQRVTDEGRRLSLEPRIETTFSFFLYLGYALAVLCADVLNFFRFLAFPASHFDHIIFVPVFFAIYCVFARSRFEFPKDPFTLMDACGLAVLTGLALLRMPFPDFGYDSINYHIALQTNRMGNNISDSFFPAGGASYLSPLGDALLYGFRLVLGYRAGTLFQLWTLFVLYFQIKNLLRQAEFPESGRVLAGGLALLAITTDYSVLSLSTYMIDLTGVPFAVAVFGGVIRRRDFGAGRLRFLFLLGGICVAIKLTYLPFIAILLLFYWLKSRKHIHLRDFITASPYFVAPFGIYCLYAAISTGNPVFPLFNSLFQSPYIRPTSFSDLRWGAQSAWGKLFWPVSSVWDLGRVSEIQVNSGRMGMGMILALAAVFRRLVRPKQAARRIDQEILLLLGLVSWSFLTGYFRYAIHLEIISGLLIAGWIIRFFQPLESRFKRSVGASLLLCLAAQSTYGVGTIIARNLDWAWRPSVVTDPGLYLDNLKQVGRDREGVPFQGFDSITVWATTSANNGLAAIIKPGIPAIDLDLAYWESDEIRQKRKERLQRLAGRTVYSVAFENNIKETVVKLADEGFSVDRIFPVTIAALKNHEQALIIRTTYGSKGAAPEEGANVILDPSFEQVLTPDNRWHIEDPKNQVVMSDDCHDGRVCVKAPVQSPITQKTGVRPKTVYHLSLFSKGDSECADCPIRLQILWYDGDRELGANIVVENSGPKWEEHDAYFVSPASANAAIVFVNSHSEKPVEFDRVSLRSR
jgi:hypothetical protein